ncbi:MAG: transcriptional regulator [Leptospira sp.]|nr:transcriptional regulator [Leptospira sp.]
MKSAHLDSAKFMIQSQLERYLPSVLEESYIQFKKQNIPVDIYHPAKREKNKGTIMTVMGLSPLGNKDPRFLVVNKSLAGAGYTVVSPYFQDICEYRIQLSNVTVLVSAIREILKDDELCRNGKISLFAPSFAAGICLIAAGDSAIANNIESICTVGTYGNVETILESLLLNQEMDEYGRMILLYNFLELSMGKNEILEKAFRLVILDNFYSGIHKKHTPEFPEYFASMPKKEKVIFEKLKNDRSFRGVHWKRIEAKGGSKRRMLTELSVAKNIHKVKAAVTLIHGDTDNVIPPKESELLFEILIKNKIPAHLVLTPLITHGDSGVTMKTIPAVFKLGSGFEFFFRNIGRQK